MFCPVCGVEFVSRGKLYAHQVLTREVVVSPWEYSRVKAAEGPIRAQVDYTSRLFTHK